MIEDSYLTNIPKEVNKYGFSKVLAVRSEVIHLKHILTEIFVRKTINIYGILDKVDYTLFKYIEFITNRLRKIHRFSRNYTTDINKLVKSDKDTFFPTIELFKGLDVKIVLDFDGVITKNSFRELYKLCTERTDVFVCSANPNVSEEWFINNNLPLPKKIFACKGKKKKMKCLLELIKKHDFIFYVDDEPEYLKFAWIFGIKTFIYSNNKIKYFTLNTK